MSSTAGQRVKTGTIPALLGVSEFPVERPLHSPPNNTDPESLLGPPNTDAVSLLSGDESTTSTMSSPCLRDQSHRLAQAILSQTELASNTNESRITPPPPPADSRDGGGTLRHWIQATPPKLATAQEHGGDCLERLNFAFRSALGSFLVFSVLVWTRQDLLGAVWIGNIFLLVNIQDSVGASIRSVSSFASSLVLTTVLVSLPTVLFFNAIMMENALLARVVLPFVVFAETFVIMSCPQLAAHNVMVLTTFLVVGSSIVQPPLAWWQPLSLAATYIVSMGFAIVAQVLPWPNTAVRAVHGHLERLQKDFTMLVHQGKHYATNAAAPEPRAARAAIASIEMLHHRISETARALQHHLPAAQVELWCTCRWGAAKDLTLWVHCVETILAPIKSLHAALTNRALGEEHHIYSTVLRQAKGILNEDTAASRDRLMDAMVAALATCHAWADPCAPQRVVVLPDIREELQSAIQSHQFHFYLALRRAAQTIDDNNNNNSSNQQNRNSNISLLAHLTRRMASFNSLFEMAEKLLDCLNKRHWETQRASGGLAPLEEEHESRQQVFATSVPSLVGAEWLWHDADKCRLALKTAVGMFLGSLFLSVPQLWDLASPFGIWPGMMIASVSLSDTGSSFHKAGDRLFGTLLAAAFALLLADLLPENRDSIRIPAIALFTFVVLYLKSIEHEHMYSYAAASIGSMLYGSLENSVSVAGYVPKRIQLMFTGVLIFAIVELLVFPRSSRRMVEKLALAFFGAVRSFVHDAAICTRRMQTFSQKEDSDQRDNLFETLLGEGRDPFRLKKLEAAHSKLSALSTDLNRELQSGIREPHIGFSLQLDASSYRGLSVEVTDCTSQAALILKSIQHFATVCAAGMDAHAPHPLAQTRWPQMYADFCASVFQVADKSCQSVRLAYPDGRLRPQSGNAIAAVVAASTLREFGDVRLRILAAWVTAIYSVDADYDDNGPDINQTDPSALMATSIATTRLLDFCRHLQRVGRHVEAIAHSFPPAK